MTTRALHRYHGLDALRAAMMLLGLVLHSAAAYITLPLPVWIYRDPDKSGVFSPLFFFIHLFRMPVFFVAAGFFAAMLMTREGPGGFLETGPDACSCRLRCAGRSSLPRPRRRSRSRMDAWPATST